MHLRDVEYDWMRPAGERGVPLDVARRLYRRAELAGDPRRVEAMYLRWLSDAAAAQRPAASPPAVPGRRTRVAADAAPLDACDALGPGKQTRVLLETTDARPGAALAAEMIARLAPHVGSAAAGAARLHTDAAADRIAASHRARALTVGSDIYFARGEYAPGTSRGDELLVHELTHVAQGQRGELTRAAAKGIDSGGPLDPAEAEADLRARLAVYQLHPPEAAVPALAAPSAPPASAGDRGARIAAQQQRIALADQAAAPLVDPPVPARATPQAPIANPPPVMTAPAARTATPNPYVAAFEAPPSKQATTLWATAGTQATARAAADQAAFAAALPKLPVALAGVDAPAGAAGTTAAATPGATDPATATAGAVPPGATTAPPAAQPTADQVAQQVTANLAAMFAANPADTSTAAVSQAQSDGRQAIDALPTTAPAVVTDPGAAPMTDLAGQADPVRAIGDRQRAIGDGARALDTARREIIAGPGAARVQPIKLDEQLAVPPATPTGALPALPVIPGMTKFAGWNLPADAQAAFDQAAKPKMEPHLAQAKVQMTQAETTRDADRSTAITDAQAKVADAHTDADRQQQTKVAETRARIANQQADALVAHEAEIKKLDQQAGTRKTSTITRINDRITADQAKVDTDFKDAQKRADDRKKQGEDEAARKKQEAQDQANNQSWWDQLVGAISDAIQSIANEITQVLDAIGTAIGQIIDEVKTAACQLIDAARDFVCQALTELGDWLKSAVDALIGSVFPELAAALDALIDQAVAGAVAAVNAVADDLKAGVTALCDGLKAAIDGVLAAFKAAVQAAATLAQAALTGDWGTVARLVIDGILAALGIDPAAFYALIGTASASLDQIVADPGAFVGHLVDAVKLGFHQFGDNFWIHLQSGVVQWLFGTFAQAGITMPARFDLAGIFDLVCQVLGLTWPRLRGKVVTLIGEENTERLELVAGYLEALVTGGFAGLWDKIQQDLSGLWDMVVGGIRDWLVQNVVQAALIKLATMWNPVGAIFQLIQTAWNAYQWLRENAQRIFGLVEAVVNSISNIVAGDIGGAANFIEGSLARLVPIAISLFADLIGLGGISEQIKHVIEGIQESVDRAIDALIERVMAMFKGGADDPDGDAEEPEVPKSLAEPAPAEIEDVDPALGAQLGDAEPGEVIYQRSGGDPKQVTEDLLAAHPDATFDKTTGQLTLPPLDAGALAGATSLAEIGALAAAQTGVSKVTVTTTAEGVVLRGHINPDAAIVKLVGNRAGEMTDEERAEIFAMIERIANDIWDHGFDGQGYGYNLNPADPAQGGTNQAVNDQAIDAMTGGGSGPAVPAVPEDDLFLAARQAEATQQQVVFHPLSPSPDAADQDPGGVTTVEAGDAKRLTDTDPPRDRVPLNYDAIIRRLQANHSSPDIAAGLNTMRGGGGIPPSFRGGDADDMALLRDILFNVEIQREPRNLVFSAMAIESLAAGAPASSVLGRRTGNHPATMQYAAEGYSSNNTRPGSRRNVKQAENRRRQIDLLDTWFQAQLGTDATVAARFTADRQTLPEFESFLRTWVRDHWLAASQETGQDGGPGTSS